MTDLRTTAQQSLEALESCAGVPHWPALQPTITALRKALAQQEQEPVAWVEKDGELVWCDKARATGRNLYIRPPRREWQSLTEEELAELAHQEELLLICDDFDALREIARAIEAALKEKNNG